MAEAVSEFRGFLKATGEGVVLTRYRGKFYTSTLRVPAWAHESYVDYTIEDACENASLAAETLALLNNDVDD